MMHNFQFYFQELAIQKESIGELLGFDKQDIPEPFQSYIDEAFAEAQQLCSIRGAVLFFNQFHFSPDYSSFALAGKNFECGKLIGHELKSASQLGFFLCTAGDGISQRSQQLLHGDDPAKGYVFDVLGSLTVETAMDRIQKQLEIQFRNENMQLSNRYSPGYCDWHVQDQHKLFSLFPENQCNITLNQSALMHPIKSTSGIMAAGPNVTFHEHRCNHCNSSTCIYRNLRNQKY